jgi:hypothetical protein
MMSTSKNTKSQNNAPEMVFSKDEIYGWLRCADYLGGSSGSRK